MSEQIDKVASEAWRDHVLKHMVDYLETNRDAIIDSFEAENAHNLKREDIEQSDLLDFDVSVTLHRDFFPGNPLPASAHSRARPRWHLC